MMVLARILPRQRSWPHRGTAIITQDQRGAARFTARLGETAGAVVAGRNGRDSQRAARLSAGLRLRARARRLRARKSSPSPDVGGGGGARVAGDHPLRARYTGQRSAGDRPGRRFYPGGAGRGHQRRRRQSRLWTRWERWPTAWRDGRAAPPIPTRAPRPRCPRISTWRRATASSSPTTSATGVCASATRAMRSAACSQCARRRSSARAPCSRLTRAECVNPGVRVTERDQADELRAEVLDRVDAAALPGYLKNRVLMRRASVWSAIAYQHTRKNLPSDAAADRALTELAGSQQSRTHRRRSGASTPTRRCASSASRWAVLPAAVAAKRRATSIVTEPGEPGQTCVPLVDAKRDIKNPLAGAALTESCGRTPRR